MWPAPPEFTLSYPFFRALEKAKTKLISKPGKRSVDKRTQLEMENSVARRNLFQEKGLHKGSQ